MKPHQCSLALLTFWTAHIVLTWRVWPTLCGFYWCGSLCWLHRARCQLAATLVSVKLRHEFWHWIWRQYLKSHWLTIGHKDYSKSTTIVTKLMMRDRIASCLVYLPALCTCLPCAPACLLHLPALCTCLPSLTSTYQLAALLTLTVVSHVHHVLFFCYIGCEWGGWSWHHLSSILVWCWGWCCRAQEGNEGDGWVEITHFLWVHWVRWALYSSYWIPLSHCCTVSPIHVEN